jgi:hypothetical protein
MKNLLSAAAPIRMGSVVFSFALFSFLLTAGSPNSAAQATSGNKETIQQSKPRSGTTLPVVLSTSLTFDKCKPGQVLRGKIDKDVPLPNGAVIRKGSEVEGHVVEVTPAANGSGANVAMQFDKLDVNGQKVPVVTNLKAIGDNAPALWAFRVDATGNYGIDNLLIAHAGNTEPVGKIVLASQAQNLKLEKGDALLLLVD